MASRGFQYTPGGGIPLPPSPRVIQAERPSAAPQLPSNAFTPTNVGGGVIMSPQRPTAPLTIASIMAADEEEEKGRPSLRNPALSGGRGGDYTLPEGYGEGADDGGLWGAIKGGLGTVVGAIGTAADYPHRTFMASADLLGGLTNQLDDQLGLDVLADSEHEITGLDEWWDRVRGEEHQPRFGEHFADATGNKWIDRGIGFVGDVASDPLSYLGAGGVRTAGAGGRATQAAKAAERGLSPEIIDQIGRRGVASLDDATRQQLDLGRAGLTFGQNRIPGTGGLARASGQAISGARQGLAKLPGAGAIRDLRTAANPEGQALRRLAFGEGDIGGPEAAAILQAAGRGKGAAGVARTGDLHAFDRLLKEVPRDQRKVSIYAIEESDEPWAQQLRGLMGDAKERAVEAGIDIGDRGARYAPHFWTDKGRKFLGWADEEQIPGTVSSLGERKILPGQTIRVKGQEIPIEQGTAREINEKLKGMFPEFKGDFIETDATKVLPRYLENMAEATGRGVQVGEMAQRGAAYLPERGSITQPSDVMAGGDEFAQAARDDVVALSQLDDGTAEMATTRALLGDYLMAAERKGGDRLTPDEIASITAKGGGTNEEALRLMSEGWEVLDGAYKSTGALVPPEVGRLMRNAQEGLQEPGRFGKLWKANMDFFRTYATLSPGFHVRNAYSATFMNLADGVNPANQLKAINHFKKFIKEGDDWLSKVPPKDRELAEQALEVTYASGAGGRYATAETGMTSAGRVLNNPATRWSIKRGESVEGSVRYAAAYDALSKGQTFDEALNRVRSLHFDYGQLSGYDRNMKQVIPFWTFMSRNLPLQMQMMVSKPGRYQAWEHFKENVGDDDQLLPLHWQQAGAFALPAEIGGAPVVIDPQLPHLSALEDVRKLGDPLQMIANTATPIKLPIEKFAGKQSFSGIPFEDDAEFWRYAAGSVVPSLGKAGRSAPLPFSPGYQEGADFGDARVRELGLPFHRLTPDRVEGELKRLEFEGMERAMLAKLREQYGVQR